MAEHVDKINSLPVPYISLISHRILTNNTKNKSKKQSVNIKIESLFFNLHDVMKSVVVAKILHEALRFMEFKLRPLSSSHHEG